MWNIFSGEDLTLHSVKTGKEEKFENGMKRKTTFNGVERNRSFVTRKSLGSFNYYDTSPAYYTTENDYRLNNLRRAFRKKYRIARTNLLKLIKIIKRFPEINDESEENINVSAELLKRLNKVINKIDVEKLKEKKKKQPNTVLNKTMDTINTKLTLNKIPSNVPFFSYRKSEIPRPIRTPTRKNYLKPNFTFDYSPPISPSLSPSASPSHSPLNFRNFNKSSSFDNLGASLMNTSLQSTLRNCGYFYNNPLNLKKPKIQTSRFFNHKNSMLLTNNLFNRSSSLNTNFNKMNILKRRPNLMMSHNFKGHDYLNSYESIPSFAFDKNLRSGNVKNHFTPQNYHTHTPNYPLLSNVTQYIYSPLKKVPYVRKRMYSNKQVKKFSREEHIRSLLRTATNEGELIKAIDVAKNAGLNFEAKLGDKKLQKLKSNC